VMSLCHNDNLSHMTISKCLVMANHAHTWWYNRINTQTPSINLLFMIAFCPLDGAEFVWLASLQVCMLDNPILLQY